MTARLKENYSPYVFDIQRTCWVEDLITLQVEYNSEKITDWELLAEYRHILDRYTDSKVSFWDAFDLWSEIVDNILPLSKEYLPLFQDKKNKSLVKKFLKEYF